MSGPSTPKAHCSPNALRRFRFPQEYPCYVDGAYDYRPAKTGVWLPRQVLRDGGHAGE